jgi:hypothetical protein
MPSFFSFKNKFAFKNNKALVRSSNLTLSNTANVDSAFWNGGERATSVGTNGGPSYYGCYDMMGNNWQWTDLYAYPSPIKGSLGLFWGNSGPGSSLKAVMGSAAYWDHKASQAYSTFGVRIASLTNPDSLPNFVLVGDSGNARDVVRNQWNSMLFGDVAYNYYINKYQLTVSEYVEFLNSVAATDTYNLYKCPLIDGSLNPETSILRTGASGSYSYSVKTNYSNKPVGNLSWFMAARYCNWLHNGKPSGSQNSGTTETGAYTLNGTISGNAPIKNSEARYSMPSMNEWYKAAYYKGGGTNAGYWLYPTQSNIRPVSVLADQNGNGTTIPTTLSPPVSTGTNVTTSQVQDNIFNMGLSLTYANISSTGVTKITPITQNDPKLPINFSLSNNLGKYNISTTSTRSGNIDLCFVLPSSISLATFNKTKIFHTNSSGITTDITITTGTSAPKYSTRTICGRSANFSDFHLIPENDISSYPIPTNISGSGSNGKVSLSWNISDPTDVYDYSIKYSSDSGNSWDEFAHTPLTGFSIDVDGLKNNTNYVFRVAAIGISGGVADYATASPTITPVPGCPDTVSGVSATADFGSAIVSWNVPNNNGSTNYTDIGFASATHGNITVAVANTTATGNVIRTSGNAQTLELDMPLTFDASFGGLTAGATYFVKTVANATAFTVSATQGGDPQAITSNASVTGNAIHNRVVLTANCPIAFSNAAFVYANDEAGYIVRQKGKQKYLVTGSTSGLTAQCYTANLANTALTPNTMRILATYANSSTQTVQSLSDHTGELFTATSGPIATGNIVFQNAAPVFATFNTAAVANADNGQPYELVTIASA